MAAFRPLLVVLAGLIGVVACIVIWEAIINKIFDKLGL